MQIDLTFICPSSSLYPLRLLGYHFIDIPLINVAPIALPTSRRMKQFLTDFDEPRRFLEIEDFRDLDSEPCGELDVSIQQIGAGGDSKFLPEVSTICFLKR